MRCPRKGSCSIFLTGQPAVQSNGLLSRPSWHAQIMQARPVSLKIRNLHLSGRHGCSDIKIHHGVHKTALLDRGQSLDLQQ